METPRSIMYNLQAFRSSDAKRIWRERIFERDSHQCQYCGSKEDLTIDHIVPRSKGGDRWDASNCTTACRPCNQLKGSMQLATFLSLMTA